MPKLLVFDGLGDNGVTWYVDPKGAMKHVSQGARVLASEVPDVEGFVLRGQAHLEGEDDGANDVLASAITTVRQAVTSISAAAAALPKGASRTALEASALSMSKEARKLQEAQDSEVAAHHEEQERLAKEAAAAAVREAAAIDGEQPDPTPEL